MHLISFHLDGFGCGGAEILTRTATYAECLFDLGIHTPIYAALKTYSIGKTMLGAVGAEKKALIVLDYDKPLKGADMSRYAGYPVHGCISLTQRGQEVLQLLDMMGAEP